MLRHLPGRRLVARVFSPAPPRRQDARNLCGLFTAADEFKGELATLAGAIVVLIIYLLFR